MSLFLFLLLSMGGAAFSQVSPAQATPPIFPPNATLEQKRAIIVQRALDLQAAKRQAEADRVKKANEEATARRTQNAGVDFDPIAGKKPEQLEDGTVPEIDKWIRRSLKDPNSLIYDEWKLVLGTSPGGNSAWVVGVVYRAKNSYGAYTGNVLERYYWIEKDKAWKRWQNVPQLH